jgi:hypothetical protein
MGGTATVTARGLNSPVDTANEGWGLLTGHQRGPRPGHTRGLSHGHGQRPQTASPGEAVYGLGLIGALAWYWQQAQSPGERAISVLKAVVWPAFLVYDALKALHR